MKTNRLLIALLCVLLAIASLAELALADEKPQQEAAEEQFSQWNTGAPALSNRPIEKVASAKVVATIVDGEEVYKA